MSPYIKNRGPVLCLGGRGGKGEGGPDESTYSRAGEVHGPVVVVVASGRVGRVAIEVAVGDGHTVRGRVSKNNVLATDLRGLEKMFTSAAISSDKVVHDDGSDRPSLMKGTRRMGTYLCRGTLG